MGQTNSKILKGLLIALAFSFMIYSCRYESSVINGYELVDLGLPSGTKWATMNVGAESMTDYGSYYAWGETSTKEEYTCENSYTNGKCSDMLIEIGMLDEDKNFNSVCDAASASWGDVWETPTKEDFLELFENTESEWVIMNGVKGRKFTASNGQWIFLPAAGRHDESGLYDEGCYGSYWSASASDQDCYSACGFMFWSESVDEDFVTDRKCGQTIRPVYKKGGNRL